MPRKYDKYGFNRQYLRRPCTRANPFPYRLPFDNGFSTRTLLYTLATRPSTKVKPPILAASVTRSGKEFKGFNMKRPANSSKSRKRAKLSDVADKVLAHEAELAMLSSKAGVFFEPVQAVGQVYIIHDALMDAFGIEK
jgi:hypothetical protein